MIFGLATRVNLLLQIQQVQMTGHVRAEPRNLDVVA